MNLNKRLVLISLSCIFFESAFSIYLPVGRFYPENRESNPLIAESKSSGAIRDVIKRNSPRYRKVLIRNNNRNIVFNTEDSHYMTSRAKSKLDILASLVQNNIRTKLRVLQAWTDDVDPNNKLSLHYEGRALMVNLENNNQRELDRVVNYALEAGFDWIWRKSADAIHISVIPDVCQTKLDLAFVVDTSGSVHYRDFQQVQQFLKKLIDFFNIGPDETHVALVSYSYSVRVEFPLNRYFDKQQLKNGIDRMYYQGSNTATGDALMTLVQRTFTEREGMRKDKSIPKIAILLTDGKSNGGGRSVRFASNEVKKAGINVFVIGVTRYVNTNEARLIASPPFSEHYVPIRQFNELSKFVDKISTVSCDEGAQISQCEKAESDVDGGSFRYFRVQFNANVRSVSVEVTDIIGQSFIYTSLQERNPGPLSGNTQKVEGTISPRTISVQLRPGVTNILYVSVQGQKDQNRFSLSIWDSLFPQNQVVKSIKEEQPGRTLINTVKVQTSGSFKYYIKDGNSGKQFNLEERTGRLYVVKQLDREVRDVYKLSIVAQDLAEPCHKGLMILTVNVEDINDNAPNFDNVKPVSIREDVPKGQYISQVRAVDKDAGKNGELSYSLRNLNDVFQIDSKSGRITLKASVDYETKNTYDVELQVKDGGSPPKYGGAILRVNIIDVNEKPYFTGPPCLLKGNCDSKVIEEKPAMKIGVKVTAADPDVKQSCQLTYRIVSLDRKYFTVDSKSGEISTTGPLDREVRETYTIDIAVFDCASPPLRDIKRFYVKATDINDSKPKFQRHLYEIGVKEDKKVNTEVITVVATDADSGLNGQLTYTLKNIDKPGVFRIDSKSGKIYLSKALDYETLKTYQLQVTATDSGSPQTKNDVAQVRVNVLDVNDNAPVIGGPTVFNIKENVGINFDVTKIPVSDRDSGLNAAVDITISDPNGHFVVGPGRVLKTVKNPDREKIDTHKVSITATDNGQPSLKTQKIFTINIQDENDNNPKFERSVYTLNLLENTPVSDKALLTVKATDADIGVNKEIKYKTENSPFAVNEKTGVITLSKLLDFGVKQNYDLKLTAEDKGTPSLKGEARLKVILKDSNDFTPKFKLSNYSAEVNENVPLNHKVLTVEATDDDKGPSGDIDYTIQSADVNGVFFINKKSGTIYTQTRLDYETRKSYALTIKASDRGNPSKSGTCRVTINVKDINDNVPTFQIKKMKIKENSKIGAKVDQLIGSDKDSGVNAEFEFTFLTKNIPFQVTSAGVISVTKNIDREIKDTYKIKVQIRDKGNPRLSSSDDVIIQILDDNDNVPQFSQKEFFCSLGENRKPETHVCNVLATDRDIGLNGRVKYSLVTSSIDVTINEDSGEVTTLRPFDRERDDKIILRVKAEDKGVDKVLSNETQLTITVLDENDNAPVCKKSLQTLSVEEQKKGLNVIGSIEATDADISDNGLMDYVIERGDKTKFSLEKVNNEKYNIKSKELDREKKDNYYLYVRARDRGPGRLSAVCRVKIAVTDINDNVPKFTESNYYRKIKENVRIGTLVLQVKATDADINENGQIVYDKLEGTNNDHFSLDKTTGEIRTAKDIDYESIKSYDLTITIRDNGKKNRFQAITDVRIDVSDENDNAPKFEKVKAVNVSEDAFLGFQVIQFSATDADGSTLTFSIKSGNDGNNFGIDRKTGMLSVIQRLDRETKASYDLVVTATDGVTPVDQNLPITILDVNDNEPIFDKLSYQASVDENKETVVLKVSATDRDIGINKQIVYSLSDNSKKYFKVNGDSGEISTVGTLDREDIAQHKFKVIATDKGTPSLSSSVPVTVKVNDLNDNAPTFERDPYNVDITENTGALANVVVIKATDPDEGDNGKVYYRLKSGDVKSFKLNEKSGQLQTMNNLDREAKNSYKLIIEAYDQGQTSQTKSVTVNIKVLDANDEKPIIKSPTSFPGVNESSPIGFVITTIKATDNDIGDNQKLSYYKQEKNNEDFFEIDEKTGVVKLKKQLQREVKDEHILIIKVRDHGRPSLTGIKQYTVKVLDANNQPPVFSKTKYQGTIKENINTKTELFKVETTDLDTPPNAQNRYSLEDDKSVFQIDPATGILSAVGTIDYEKNPSYSLTIIASDWKYKKTVPAEITVINLNDNTPRFSKDSYLKYIKEDLGIGLSVLKVTATDPDPFGNLIYTIESNLANLPFKIDSLKGVITVAQKLDRETKDVYEFSVIVTDSGNPALSSKATVKIGLLDVNDNAPYFEKDSMSVELLENKAAGTQVAKVLALDKDLKENAIIIYFAEQKSTDFSIDPQTGVIKSKRPFDRENPKEQKLSFKIRARDMGGLKSDVFTLYVTILDENDNAPIWEKTNYKKSVKEHTATNTNILKVSASDKDLENNALIDYSIKEKNSPFSIASRTGVISIKEDIDREKLTSANIQVTLIARDNGASPKESETQLVVTIEDINDNKPIIDKNSLKGEIEENVKQPMKVAQIVATDKDIGKNAELVYKIANNDIFTIEVETGIVKAIRPLDREEKSSYKIKVTVADKGSPSLESEGILNITVLDVDDNCPVFVKQRYDVYIKENVAPGTSVVTVEATDRDIGKNARLNFGIAAGDDGGIFDIDQDTGKIFVKGEVDAEYVRAFNGSYTLKIRAGLINCGVSENGTNVGEGETPVENNSTLAIVKIYPENVNDNPPRFTISNDKIIFDDIKTVKVTTVTAIDPDGDEKITFYSKSDETTQKLVDSTLENHMIIRATDNGEPPLESNHTIIVANKIQCNAMQFSVNQTGEVTVQTLCSVKNMNAGILTLKKGNGVTLKCSATGNSEIEFQWLKDGTPYTTLSKKGEYTIKNVEVQDSGSYACSAKSIAGTLLSEPTILSVQEKPTAIVQPVDTTVAIGNDAKLKFVASGTPTPIYQWFKDDRIINEGGKQSELVLEDSIQGDSAKYYCVAKNAAGEIKSNEVELRIVDPDNVVKMKLNTFDKDKKNNCSNFFPDELEKHLSKVLDKKVVVTKVKADGKTPLCKKNACSKNPCANFGKCNVVGETYKCQCGKNWSGKNCLQDYDECAQDSNICYNGGVCKNLIGSFSCECKGTFSGHRCEYKGDACANATCDKEKQYCVSSLQNGFSCIDKKSEVTIVLNRKSNLTGKNEKFDIEDLLNQILKLQPQSIPSTLYSLYARTIDFSGCTIHILDNQETENGQVEVKIVVDCHDPTSNDTSGFSPVMVKKLCAILLQQGQQVQACGHGEELEKKEPEKVEPSVVEVEVVSETKDGKTSTAEETIKSLEETDLDLKKINLESIDISQGKSKSKNNDNKKTIVIGVVCAVLGIMLIVIVLVIYHRRRQPSNKHTLILQQRSVVSNDGGELSPRVPGNYRENLAYTEDEVEASKGFMFEMPTNLKSTENGK